MPRKKNPISVVRTGVTLESPVCEYLDALKDEGKGKDRSAVMNFVIREYAKKNGRTIPSAALLVEQATLPLRG